MTAPRFAACFASQGRNSLRCRRAHSCFAHRPPMCNGAIFGAVRHIHLPPKSTQKNELQLGMEDFVGSILRRRYKDADARALIGVQDELLRLNGFRPVKISANDVPLSEGVVATVHRNSLKEYHVFARKSRRASVGLPPFRDKGFTPIGALENRTEQWLTRRAESLHGRFEKQVKRPWEERIHRPLARIRSRIGKGGKIEESDPTTVAVVEQTENLETQDKLEIEGGDQDVLIVTREGVLVVESVASQLTLLVLPPLRGRPVYRLRFTSASTLLYSSMVLFGALPLAYRSAKFVLDYPALAHITTASVVGTIAYGLWQNREGARVRCSLTLASAAAARTVARDRAALAMLVDEAVAAVSEEMLSKYRHENSANGGLKEATASFKMSAPPLMGSLGIDETKASADVDAIIRQMTQTREALLRRPLPPLRPIRQLVS